jgi:integrase
MEVILTAQVPYVRTRDGVYQYERRVPASVQRDARRFAEAFGSKILFRRSLHTKRQGDMFAAAQAVHEEFESLIGGPKFMKPKTLAPVHQPLRTVTEDDLAAIADQYSRIVAEPTERMQRFANVNPAAASEFDRLAYQFEIDAEDIKRTLRSIHDDTDGPIIKPADAARRIVMDQGFDAADNTEALGAVIGAVRTGMERGYQRVGAIISGDAVPSVPVTRSVTAKAANLTLADAVDRYLQDRAPAPKTISETRLALRQFENVVGRKSLASIDRADARLFVQYLAGQQVGGKTAGSIRRNLSEQSIKKRLRMLSSAIFHARDIDQFKGDNPLSNVRLSNLIRPTDRSVMPDKRRLQISELNAIFAHPWFTGCHSPTETHMPGSCRLTGAEYWVPVVAVLTGCRAGELGGIKLSEVRLEGELPHLLIRSNEHRRTKNGRSRCVPILDALIELGFPAYVEGVRKSGETRLFPDWTAIKPAGSGDDAYPAWSNGRVIRAFNRTVIPTALADKLAPDARREVTFHSLRGAFKAMIGTTNNLPMNVVHEVVGHAKSALDERYIGEVTIEETYPMVRGLSYDGLLIPKGIQ